MAKFDSSGTCVLNEAQKTHYSFYCPLCQMIRFLDFQEAASEVSTAFLKRRQFVIKLQLQIKEQRIRWEERRRNSKFIRRIFEQ